MKKIISVMVLFTFIATTSVFAVPVTNTVSLATTGENNLEEDLFSSVQATPLSGLEMVEVEGAWGILAIVGICLLGAGIGAGFALIGISLIF